jgi:hypothetical protein
MLGAEKTRFRQLMKGDLFVTDVGRVLCMKLSFGRCVALSSGPHGVVPGDIGWGLAFQPNAAVWTGDADVMLCHLIDTPQDTDGRDTEWKL